MTDYVASLVAIVATLAVLAASTGLGAWTLVRLGLSPGLAGLSFLVLAPALGLGLLAYAVLGLGLLGMLEGRWILVPLAVGGAGLWTERRRLRRAGSSMGPRTRRWLSAVGWPERVAVSVILLGLGVSFLAALAPITGVDPLVYHLAVPDQYVRWGRVAYVPFSDYAATPATMQMIYAVVLLLGAPEGAQLLQWVATLALVGSILWVGRRLGSVRAGILGGAVFLGISDVAYGASHALVDTMAAWFLVGAAMAAWLGIRQGHGAWLLVAGLLAGFHASVKLTTIVGAGALGAALIAYWVLYRRNEIGRGLRLAAAYAIPVLLLAGVWYLRAWWYTGNPFFPYLYSIFGGRNLDPEQARYLFEAQYYDIGNPYNPGDFLRSPLTLTFFPADFNSGYIGPLYAGLLPGLFFIRRRKGLLGFVLLAAAIYYVPWYWIYPRVRTLFPVLALLSAPVGLVLQHFLRQGRPVRMLAASLLAAWLTVGLAANVRFNADAAATTLGLVDRETYLERELVQDSEPFLWYSDYGQLNDLLPRDARVLLFETRGYYLERDYVWARGFIMALGDPTSYTPQEILTRMREAGITHVAYDTRQVPPNSPYSLDQLRNRLQASGALREIYRSETMRLFRVDYAG